MKDKKGNIISKFMFQLALADCVKEGYFGKEDTKCGVCGLVEAEIIKGFRRVRCCEKCYQKHNRDIIALKINKMRSHNE